MNREIKYDKSIRALKNNARKNNFYSAFQLYEYYLNGKYVNVDNAEAQRYLDMSYNIFKNQSLKLEKIDIKNYRVFDDIVVSEFDSNLNIFVGNNGAGKTTFLDAIELSLSWLSISINKNGGSGNSIEIRDINNYSDQPNASVLSSIKINKHIKTDIALHKARVGRGQIRNKLNEVKTVGDFYKTANEFDNQFNMPLFAYYNVMRSYDVNPKDLRNLDNLGEFTVIDKFDAYDKSLNGKTDFSSFVKWYYKSDHKISRNSSEKNKKHLLSLLGINEEMIDRLGGISDSDDDAKKLYEKFKSLYSDSTSTDVENDSLYRHRALINKVVTDFMGSYSDIEVQLEPMIDLVIKKNERKISVMQLSQGEKTLLALVLDIARRLIILNPSLENPLTGQGIVLIDEFDLHLHPKWQRSIANKLKETFPNCQFFLTTHSPLVVGEIDPKHIFIFSENSDGKIVLIRPEQSYGLTSNQILNELMNDGTTPQLGRSQIVEYRLEEIFELIEEDDRSSLELAQSKIEELENDLHGDIPELITAKTRLELQWEWLENEED